MTKNARPTVLLVVLLASCATVAGPDPADHLVIFGWLRVDSLLLDRPVERMSITQTDPGFPEMVVEPFVEGNLFYTEPLPAGGRFRIACVTVAGEELALSVEIRADGPGLAFAGSLEVVGDPQNAFAVTRRDAPDERTLLQSLLDAYRGTAWEAAIRERIRSLDRE